MLHFDPIVNVRVWVLSNHVEKTSLRVFSNSVYLYDSMFAEIVWINKPHYVMKWFIFVTMVALETRERHFFSYSNVSWEENMFHQIHHMICRYVLPMKKWVDWISHRREYCTNSKKEKTAQKLQDMIPLHFMTTIHHFALKVEAAHFRNWKCQLCFYVCMIYSLSGIKYLKRYNIKKNTYKSTKFTMKNLNKTSNLRFGLQCSSTIGISIQVTANFSLALRSKPITYWPFKHLERRFGF